MVEHIVLFKFSEATTSDQKDEAISQAKQLANHIDGILDIQMGYNFSERSKGYELGLTVRFVNKEALEIYGPHPKHQEYVQFLKAIGIVDILALDFEI